MSLNKNSFAFLKPYMWPNNARESYIQNSDGSPSDQFTIDYVPKFVSHHSYEKCNPYFSLGVAKTSVLDSLEQHGFRALKFQTPSISMYQLGNFGTAQKLLWEVL